MFGGTEVETKNEIKDRDKKYTRVEEKKREKEEEKQAVGDALRCH